MQYKSLMTKSCELNDLRKAIINELEVFQDEQEEQEILRISNDDMDEVMKIIQKKGAGRVRVKGTHGNSARAKRRTSAVFYFVHRKGIISMEVFLTIEKVKEGKNFSVQRINDIYYLFGNFPWDGLMYRIYGQGRFRKIEDYLSRRQIREGLRKANKCGIDVSSIKEENLTFVDFKEPCFLLVGTITKRTLYTPYGKFEIKGFVKDARKAFSIVTGARRVPYGKDAMKKIEALLIQASI